MSVPPYMNLHAKLEDMLYAWLKNKLPGEVNVYRAAEMVAWDRDMKEPYVAVAVARSTPSADDGFAQRTSTRALSVALQIRTHAEDVADSENVDLVIQTCRDAHNLLVGTVLDMIYAETIVSDLAAVPVEGIAVQQARLPEQSIEPRERSYITTLSFEVLCSPA